MFAARLLGLVRRQLRMSLCLGPAVRMRAAGTFVFCSARFDFCLFLDCFDFCLSLRLVISACCCKCMRSSVVPSTNSLWARPSLVAHSFCRRLLVGAFGPVVMCLVVSVDARRSCLCLVSSVCFRVTPFSFYGDVGCVPVFASCCCPHFCDPRSPCVSVFCLCQHVSPRHVVVHVH